MSVSAAELAELLELCEDDPVAFNTYVLQRAPYWEKQEEICRAVVENKTTVVESGNSIGKSYLLAGLALWWLYTRPGSLITATAPSQTLLGTVLFKEMRAAIAETRIPRPGRPFIPLPGKITDSASASPQVLAIDGTGYQVLGIATRGVERFSGQHNPDLFQLIDEASGIESPIWEAMNSQNPVKRAIFGNPIKAEGEFVEVAKLGEKHAKDASIPGNKRTKLLIIPSTASPDIHLERSPRGLADKGFLDSNRERYGEDSLWWRTHILAQRPTVSTEGLLPPHWLDFAVAQRRPEQPIGIAHLLKVKRLACDLGEGVGKDKTVIIVRDDLGILEVAASNAWGLPEAAAEMAKLARQYNVPDHHCSYDALGIGRDMPNHLHRHGLKARPYRGSASVKGDFANMRSYCGWKLRQRLDPDRDDPHHPGQKQVPFILKPGPWWLQMREEMAEVKYELIGQKVKLENKDDLMIRLGRSPDFFDAVAQSFSPL